MTNTRRNIVGHCFKPSVNTDKIYMCCIRQVGSKWHVLTKWARNGAKMNGQGIGEFDTEAEAEKVQKETWDAQVKKGYLDITGLEYMAHMQKHSRPMLTLNDQWIRVKLELEENQTAPVDQSPPSPEMECPVCGEMFWPWVDKDGNGVSICRTCNKERFTKNVTIEEMEMECVNNTGIEEQFDIGISYLAETHPTDKKMVKVYDRFGQKVDCFKSRFKKLKSESEETIKAQFNLFIGEITESMAIPKHLMGGVK
jgi:predicted DNA-binding WGR domain protein